MMVLGRRWWWMPGVALLAVAGLAAGAWAAEPRHGIAVGTEPKYPAGFAAFEYARPDAPTGGSISLSAVGNFDKLNPFSLKGREPLLLAQLVFESLGVHSLDEPISVYGLLAESFQVAEDLRSATYRLRPGARFADGHPVTAADVKFSFRVLREEGANPFFRYYYHDISEVEVVDEHTVRIHFARVNPELPLITAEAPILPEHFYGQDFARKVLGSGPYEVAGQEFGDTITYRRREDYWGEDLNVNAGKHNFERIEVKYYRDDTVRLEALKAGEFDFMFVNNSKQWAQDVGGDKWERGWVVKETLPHRNTAGMQGFAFNLRKPLFRDRRVRHALSLAFDFEWSNRTLFYGQYTALDSFYDNSELAAEGLPSEAELELLEPLREHVPAEVFERPMGRRPAVGMPIRRQLRRAAALLREAGWEVSDGVLTHRGSGREMRFEILLVSPAWLRIVEPYLANLRKLGVRADMRVVDESIYEKRLRTRDFDMVVQTFPQSQSPGNEQRDFWHSASADVEGSRNVIGIANPAVDALVQEIITARSREALLTATHALDRVLWFGHYVVPHWYIDRHRITYWNRFDYPDTLPRYYNPLQHLMFWWHDAPRARRLEAAMDAGRALEP